MFLHALSVALAVPLVVEPTSHCRLLEEIVVGAACDAYPFLKIRKKKSWVRDLSLKFMNDRDHVLRMFQRRKMSLHSVVLRVVFRFWAHGHRCRFSVVRGFSSRAVLMNYYRAYAQLWYHNKHVYVLLEMDRLNMLDDKSQVVDKI